MDKFEDLVLKQMNLYEKLKTAFDRYERSQEVVTIGGVEARLLLLDSTYNKYRNNHSKLLELADQKTIAHEYFTNDCFSLDNMEETYTIQYRHFLERKRILKLKEAPNSHPVNTSVATASHIDRKLPALPIPKFNGNYRDWISFKNLFTALVIDSSRTSAEKFSYLKDTLSDEPLFLIKNLTVTVGQFEELIWKTLTNHYDNNKNIIYAHVNAFYAIKKMSSETATQLRSMINELTDSLESLRALGAPVEHWDYLLVPFVLDKLDAVTRRDWEKLNSSSKQPAKFADLKTFLQDRLQTLSAMEGSTSQASSHKIDKVVSQIIISILVNRIILKLSILSITPMLKLILILSRRSQSLINVFYVKKSIF